MKLITELYDTKLIVEENEGTKNYFIEGVFMQSGVKNRNGRIYPKPILEGQLVKYNDTFIQGGRALGELGHPDSPTVNLERASHNIVEMRYINETDVHGKAKLLDTPYGKIAKTFVDEGIVLGVSTRGLGSLKESEGAQVVQSDFYLAAVDIVADPSAPEAFVNGIMENKEWIYESGLLVERQVEQIQNAMDSAAAKGRTEEEVLNIFEKILQKI